MARQYAPREVPTSARAQATRQRVLDAAKELVATEGVDALDTRLVAARAGASIGTVYRFWRNKHDLLQEIHPELAGLQQKMQEIRQLDREPIPDDEKWLRTRQILSLG
jgi:AcrR family transcriptional regulator